MAPILAFYMALFAASWLTMMTVHECGHVVNAWLSDGHVERVVLHPLAFSRTDLSRNPHPLFVAGGGALWGCLTPIAVWSAAQLLKRPLRYLPRFFAGFCLIANGAYLASGLVLPVGDAEDLIRLGAPRWALAAAGLPLVCVGLALWNGLGRRINPPERQAVAAALIWLGAVLVLMLALNAVWK